MNCSTARIPLLIANVLIIALGSIGCDLPTDSASSTPQVQVLGWGQNNILSPSIKVNSPQSFLVVKVRIPFALVETTQPDGTVQCRLTTEEFTLVRTKSSLGNREFAAAGAKSGPDGYTEGKAERYVEFPKKPEAIEWIVFFPLSSLDVSLPAYALRFRDKPLVRFSAKPMVDVDKLSDPQVIWPAEAKR